MRNIRTELRLECRKRKTHSAKRLPTSPKRKNREYRIASGRRRTWSSNEHVWFELTADGEMEGVEKEVAEEKDGIKTERVELEREREELNEAEAERVKGEKAEELVVILSECC